MARSQLLKDIVIGKEDIENVLLRLKIILSDLENTPINTWVKGELEGYTGIENLPPYRISKGKPTGTFIVNYSFQYTNDYVPLEHLISREQIDDLRTVHITDSIGTLSKLITGDGKSNYGKAIPTSYCYAISTEELQVANMKIEIPSNKINGIISIVRSKLVDVVMELEKEFENLDDLDISSQVKESPEKADKIVYNIEKIIFEETIKIGDKNKIKSSRFGHFFGGNKS